MTSSIKKTVLGNNNSTMSHRLLLVGPLRPASRVNAETFEQLLQVSDLEWEGILRFIRYCGLSLECSAGLLWSDVSADNKKLNVSWVDGARVIGIPLGPKLTSYLVMRRAVGPDELPIFPKNSNKDSCSLAEEFALLAIKAWGPMGPQKPSFSALHFTFTRAKTVW